MCIFAHRQQLMKKPLQISGLFLVVSLFFSYSVVAQNINFVATAKSTVETGEQFRVIYELNAEGERFTGPDFGQLRVITGPMTSSSSSIQLINGQMSRSFTQSYTYVVTAANPGDINVGPASIYVDGTKINSNSLSIKVLATSSGQNQAQNQGNEGARNSSQQTTVSDKDLYIKASVDKNNVFLGEQVIVTYRLYTKVPISNMTNIKLSAFPGFWMKNLLDDNAPIQQSRQVINGEEYVLADIRKVALFPQKIGKLNIDPMEMQCTAQLRVQSDRRRSRDPFESFFNDPFFNRNVVNIEKKLVSNPLEINVKSLPSAGKTASFDGAIGQFSLQSAIDRTELKANEAATLTYTINGSGNIELADFPAPAFPPSFEVYEPKISVQTRTANNGVSGTKKIEYLVIPRHPGTFTVPEVNFVFFDPAKKEYISLMSQEFVINVAKGTDDNNSRTIISGGQESIKILGSDIRFIKTRHPELEKKNDFFFGSSWYFVIIAGIILSFAVALIHMHKTRKLRKDNGLLRNRQATKIARKKLNKAQLFMKQGKQNDFYTEISQAIWGYLSDKFNIPLSSLSIGTVQETMNNNNIDQETTGILMETLSNCEFARFAPGDPGRKMEELYSQALEIISKIERNSK